MSLRRELSLRAGMAHTVEQYLPSRSSAGASGCVRRRRWLRVTRKPEPCHRDNTPMKRKRTLQRGNERAGEGTPGEFRAQRAGGSGGLVGWGLLGARSPRLLHLRTPRGKRKKTSRARWLKPSPALSMLLRFTCCSLAENGCCVSPAKLLAPLTSSRHTGLWEEVAFQAPPHPPRLAPQLARRLGRGPSW